MVVVGKQMTSDQELRLMRGGVVLQSGAIEGKVFFTSSLFNDDKTEAPQLLVPLPFHI